MSSVIERVEKILKAEYSTINFIELMQEIFDSMTLVAPNNFYEERSNFSSHIVGRIHIGNYTTPEGKKIAIFAVQLKKETYVEGSRSAQRSYAKKLIDGGNCDAAIVAFYTEGEPKWRLSFVRLDYEMKIEKGKLKTTENITPAKRYSFLVGKDEPCHTAVDRFRQFIIDQNANPSLDELEEAFSVEKVTKEFFDLYCEKFYQLQDYLNSNSDFIMESKKCGFTSEQFAKKLLGQIVFLYFIQRKGWLGVEVWPNEINQNQYETLFQTKGVHGKIIQEHLPLIYIQSSDGLYYFNENQLNSIDNNIEEIIASYMPLYKTWGDGPHNFLRTLFKKIESSNGLFYEECLEPLFYETLNCKRGDLSYCPQLHCRIPFLSSGLFEPLQKFDWRVSHFNIPNVFFSNKKEKGEREGTGVLDIFDRFNFTISEDEPLEHEIAIDPEMLGKIFENLLEIKDRRSMGAFYTPREIVHYMCQESLINYLARKTNLDVQSIRDFVLYGDIMKYEDIFQQSHFATERMLVPAELFKVNEAGAIIVNNLNVIDKALADVKIVDPAVGSGAFLLGMLNEIVKIRQNITAYILSEFKDKEQTFLKSGERSSYALKRHTIKNSLFAVDLEPSAVDIARLRIWLSLVIDDEINLEAASPLEGHKNPIPLPNLENNILCGNSLIYNIQGANLFDNGIINITERDIRGNMSSSLIKKYIEMLMCEQEKFFNCTDDSTKEELGFNILAYKCSIMDVGIQNAQSAINIYKRNSKQAPLPFIVWRLEFAKVFLQNGGFDIVIGNPPYVQLQKSISDANNGKVGDKYEKLGYQTFAKTGDLYCLFYELGVSLLCDNGCLAFITSNKWMRTEYGKQVRSFLAENTNPSLLIDFSGVRVFETAGVDVCIMITENKKNKGETTVCNISHPIDSSVASYVHENGIQTSFMDSGTWTIISSIAKNIKSKILEIGTPLENWNIKRNDGIKTCLNKVYVIDTKTKNELCELEPTAIDIMRPVLKGRDIHKWECRHNGLWLLLVHNGCSKSNLSPVCIDNYPAIKEYMQTYISDLQKRSDQGKTAYHLRDCAYIEDFSLPKIIFQEMEQSPAFAFDSEGKYMCLDTARIVTGEHLEYLTALFNSNLFFFSVKHFFGGGKLGATGVRMKHTFFKNFAAYVPTEAEEEHIKKIVISGQSDRDALINEFFYKKYKLSDEEILYIESDIGLGDDDNEH